MVYRDQIWVLSKPPVLSERNDFTCVFIFICFPHSKEASPFITRLQFRIKLVWIVCVLRVIRDGGSPFIKNIIVLIPKPADMSASKLFCTILHSTKVASYKKAKTQSLQCIKLVWPKQVFKRKGTLVWVGSAEYHRRNLCFHGLQRF